MFKMIYLIVFTAAEMGGGGIRESQRFPYVQWDRTDNCRWKQQDVHETGSGDEHESENTQQWQLVGMWGEAGEVQTLWVTLSQKKRKEQGGGGAGWSNCHDTMFGISSNTPPFWNNLHDNEWHQQQSLDL